MKIIMFEIFTALGEPVGGDAKQLLDLSHFFRNVGNEIEIINFRLGRRLIYRNLKLLIRLLGVTRNEIEGDVIYSIGAPSTALLTYFLGKKLGIPTVHHVTHFGHFTQILIEASKAMKMSLREDGVKFFLRNLRNILRLPFLALPEIFKRKVIVKFCLSRVSQIICSCGFVKSRLLVLMLQQESMPIIYPVVKTPEIYDAEKLQDTPMVLYFGAFYSGRGVLDLIRSFSRVVDNMPESRLLIAGHPVYEQSTPLLAKLLIKKYNLSSVTVEGYNEDILTAIKRATIICLPFRHPPFQPPLTLLEAMAAAKPVITTDVGANHEFIHDGETGFLIRPGDINDLTDKILFLLRNNDLASDMGRKAREYVEQKCSLENVAKQVLEILREVIG